LRFTRVSNKAKKRKRLGKWFENENKEKEMKDKRFSFLPTRKKEKRKADPHLAHCLLPDTRANTSQKAKSQIFPTRL